MESHAGVSDATAAFVRFAIAAGVMLPFADWSEKEVLFAGQSKKTCGTILLYLVWYAIININSYSYGNSLCLYTGYDRQ